MTRSPFGTVQLNRRGFIATSVAAGFTLAGCGRSTPTTATRDAAVADAIAVTEAARPHSGRTVTATLAPQQATIDLGGVSVQTLAYGNTIPGRLIRANVGDELALTVTNRLNRPTSVHWHGIALRNDMDGAEPATANIKAGQQFTYRFSVPHSGTYWAHPHVGLDADYGLYLPVIVDDPTEPGGYDAEWIVMLDDWTDGIGKTPQQLYDDLTNQRRSNMDNMPGMVGTTMDGAAMSDLLGGDAGDINYPYYLVNGRIPAAPSTFSVKPGQRIRIRFINAGSDTAFRVALAGHSMTVTHTDGRPVVPTEVDALLIGMAERYDVIITAADGVFPLVALAEGKNAVGRALLTTAAGTAPDPGFRPPELTKRIGTVETFTATPTVDLGPTKPDVKLSVAVQGDMMKYDWTINGQPYSKTQPLSIRQGRRALLTFDNTTAMWHPMHLHGHTFQVIKTDGSPGPRKDTVNVLPKQKVNAILVADNPGTWLLHCHNTYHQEAGMMTRLDYKI
ncbi:multicopper oxidase family protein [Mycobacterium xenopi]|uniref:Multicopper oxidase MmcO n=2 Tax=Mycobacterium xenopi TaxID=1789 RepID=A0AAD1H049_MYCXE|nr:multicopper oxidase family protein [Mycobacterium xenopi]MDA3641307.1 multicopper oxidase family protein [Mycobacterium xenopi]MDA3659051.1 multicopper oxidase family protein [Mycobacterium xenopi]MDA3663518.1 multicopper oxidase family protein [Mycobacterium xenopi]ORX18244.1 oxidase [Mycobacterium xenopi]SPX78331.1 Copper resistance protein A -like protein [Mycobacterium xenopi]